MNFDAFVKDIQRNEWNVFGVEVYEDGNLTHNFGDTRDQIHNIYSCTKTILSIAVGIAVDEGKFDISRSLLSYLPENRIPAGQKKVLEQLSIQRFMTMSVGDLPFYPEGENYLDFSLNTKITNPSDKVFNYSDLSAYLVGVALTEALETDLGKFIEKKIFEPLGIKKFEYGRCPEGYFYGASDTKLTVNELSRLGLLLYHKGVFNGTRILSESYVNEATSIQQMNREGGYGYFIWKYLDGFSINGKLGQKCNILPKRKLMISFLSHIEEDTLPLRNSMERNCLEISLNE